MAAKDKIVKYPRGTHINLGVIIFIFILVYVTYHLIAYFTATHLAVYEVEYGTIAESNTYQGLILRDEDIFPSNYTGEVNYYLKDASKAGVQTMIYSVDESGSISSLIDQNAQSLGELDDESRSEIQESVQDFSNTYEDDAFFRVYDFRQSLESQIMESLNRTALDVVQNSASYAAGMGSFHIVNAQEPGVVVYYTDGYEDVTVDTFLPEQLNELDYHRNNLKANPTINAGEPAYKVLTNEDWNIVVPVDENTYQSMQGNSTVKIRFLSDSETVNASYEFRDLNGAHYLILSLNNSMIRYANDRFEEIELQTPEQTGLKIPNSAITQKTFFVVPKHYFSQGGDSSGYGVLLVKESEDGAQELVYQPTELFFETEDAYYISEDALQEGSVIQDPVNGMQFTLQNTAYLSGVYNVNKGYAVFKQIDVLYQNAEYAIVRTGTKYGISLYDHIALNGSDVTEGELVN
ncbi:MAG: hypothetical protein IJJ13_09090 [Lachnospiraceae bacterium]|nr:hypothetical protein [Lachnospiraceae bacterium]